MAFQVADLIKNGNVVINGSTLNNMVEISSEGWKYSGLGKEGITASLEEMSKNKVIILNNVLE